MNNETKNTVAIDIEELFDMPNTNVLVTLEFRKKRFGGDTLPSLNLKSMPPKLINFICNEFKKELSLLANDDKEL